MQFNIANLIGVKMVGDDELVVSAVGTVVVSVELSQEAAL